MSASDSVNCDYKYDHDDVAKILQLRLEEEKLTKYHIYPHAPMGQSENKLIDFL